MFWLNSSTSLVVNSIFLEINKQLIVLDLPLNFFFIKSLKYSLNNNQFKKISYIQNKVHIFDFYNTTSSSYSLLNFQELSRFDKYISYTHIYYWLKITFRGKGFRVRKFFKSQKMTYNFGRSHWTKIRYNSNFFYICKIRRQNYILSTVLFKDYYKVMNQLRYIKFINWYTQRGLRVKKQKLKKRFGKISQMVSSLHF